MGRIRPLGRSLPVPAQPLFPSGINDKAVIFFYRMCPQEKQVFINIWAPVMWLWWHIQEGQEAEMDQFEQLLPTVNYAKQWRLSTGQILSNYPAFHFLPSVASFSAWVKLERQSLFWSGFACSQVFSGNSGKQNSTERVNRHLLPRNVVCLLQSFQKWSFKMFLQDRSSDTSLLFTSCPPSSALWHHGKANY